MTPRPPPDEEPAGRDAGTDLHLVIPDDLSGMADEVERIRRELRRERRFRRARALVETHRREIRGMSWAFVAMAVLVIALVGTMIGASRPPGSPPPEPLAQPDVPAGTVGGLLPDDVTLTDGQHSAPARALRRPAVLALLPDRCDCPAAVTLVALADQSRRLPTFLVAPRADDEELHDLLVHGRSGGDLVIGLTDTAGALRRVYAAPPAGLTLLLLRPDGVITGVMPGFTGTGEEMTALRGVLDGDLLAPADRRPAPGAALAAAQASTSGMSGGPGPSSERSAPPTSQAA